ncbi:hypothetical protein BD626DRAFT_271730 [Schizophyllum amplum]|uniref:Uncharacterized protein n=1 Tax=Schizophyllum amplum TaxID=97359 RepID=A0A550CF49_9AGAR|nr:hypothetical protein BD626DRAFT_271730 [Auriculariopsis ampla]
MKASLILNEYDLDTFDCILHVQEDGRMSDFKFSHRRPRQIHHIEYYWGLQKGDLSLGSPLNHVELRSDMAEKLYDLGWVLMPTQTLPSIIRLPIFSRGGMILRNYQTKNTNPTSFPCIC